VLSRHARYRTDLRRVSRAPIARCPLGELLRRAATAPPAMRLWLADRWPWTPDTGSAFSELRPRWAVAFVELAAVPACDPLHPNEAVRELNRAQDPWPTEARRILTRD
jgi:hypothetical protein